MQWKILKSEIVFDNNFFKIKKDKCRKTDGSIVENHYTIQRPPVVIIAAFTKKMKLIMINQYRHAVKSRDIEIPAGYIEKHEKNIKEGALRELLEETGYTVKKLKKIHTAYASAGLMNNKVHFFIGFDAHKIKELQLDDSEEIEVKITPWEKALKFLESGKIKDMASITGILLAKEYLNKSK